MNGLQWKLLLKAHSKVEYFTCVILLPRFLLLKFAVEQNVSTSYCGFTLEGRIHKLKQHAGMYTFIIFRLTNFLALFLRWTSAFFWQDCNPSNTSYFLQTRKPLAYRVHCLNLSVSCPCQFGSKNILILKVECIQSFTVLLYVKTRFRQQSVCVRAWLITNIYISVK